MKEVTIMGQYFYPYLEQGNKRTIYETNYYAPVTDQWERKGTKSMSGAKITEHSWVRNYFMIGFAKKLYNKAGRLIWIGDYADNEVITSADGTQTPAPIQDLRGLETNAKYGVKEVECIHVGKPFDIRNKYIINLSRKEYLSMKEYCIRSADFTFCDKDDPTPWVPHPLSLLTATYNSSGNGGDYCENSPDYDKVGRWKYDKIIIKDYLPKYAKNYNELIVTFNDNVRVPIQGVA